MNFKRTTTRSLAAVLTAAVLSLALAAGAGAAIYFVYTNGFGSKSDVQELKRAGGGTDCVARHRAKPKKFIIKFTGKRLCEYSPPFLGDSNQPDHAVIAKGQILPKQTPKGLRKAAYLGVKLRLGRGSSYELIVRPRTRGFRLARIHDSGVDAENGKNEAIKGVGSINALRLVAQGNEIAASVNGERLATIEDENADQIEGRHVAFGVGSVRQSGKRTTGAFKQVRAGVAN